MIGVMFGTIDPVRYMKSWTPHDGSSIIGDMSTLATHASNQMEAYTDAKLVNNKITYAQPRGLPCSEVRTQASRLLLQPFSGYNIEKSSVGEKT